MEIGIICRCAFKQIPVIVRGNKTKYSLFHRWKKKNTFVCLITVKVDNKVKVFPKIYFILIF